MLEITDLLQANMGPGEFGGPKSLGWIEREASRSAASVEGKQPEMTWQDVYTTWKSPHQNL